MIHVSVQVFLSHTRLLQFIDSLQETAVDACYKTWIQKKNYRDTGLEITARVLDENWWKTAGELQKLCEPTVSLLRLMDAGGTSRAIGKVYFKMFENV